MHRLLFAEKLQLLQKITLTNPVSYLDSIKDLDVTIINYKTKRKLISSDVPVISINPFHRPTIGYGCMGLIMIYPVSPHQLVVIYDGKMYPKYVGKLYVDIRNENSG